MTEHQVVVMSNMLPDDPAMERATGVMGPQSMAHVAVCRDCLWRGALWPTAQGAVDEANAHRAHTRWCNVCDAMVRHGDPHPDHTSYIYTKDAEAEEARRKK
jgi:hypothetical protein